MMVGERTPEAVVGSAAFDRARRNAMSCRNVPPRRTASTRPSEWRPLLADAVGVSNSGASLGFQSRTPPRMARAEQPQQTGGGYRPLRRPTSPLNVRRLQQTVVASACSISGRQEAPHGCSRVVRTSVSPTRDHNPVDKHRADSDVTHVLTELALKEMTKKSSNEFQDRVRNFLEAHAALQVVAEERSILNGKCLQLQGYVDQRFSKLQALRQYNETLQMQLSQIELEKRELAAEVEVLRDTIDEDTACVVCLEEQASHVLVPCGHQALCSSCCALPMEHCPVCRRSCEQKIRVRMR